MERDIRFGVVDGWVGALWSEVFSRREDAERCAETLEGSVVLVSLRVLEDAEGELWPLPDGITIL